MGATKTGNGAKAGTGNGATKAEAQPTQTPTQQASAPTPARVAPEHLEHLRAAMSADHDAAVVWAGYQPVLQAAQAVKASADNARFRLEVIKREFAQMYGAGDVDLATGIVRPATNGAGAEAP